MIRFKFFLFVMIGVASAIMTSQSLAQTHEFTSGSLTIDRPWSRPTIGSAPNSAAYLKITNRGGTPDKLMGVKSDVAKRVELHTVKMDGGIIRMRAVKGGIAVPANASVELKLGGFHIMLIGLTRKLSAGDTFDLTLQFERQGEVPVQVQVEKMGAMSGEAMKSSHGHGGHKH